VSIKIKFLILKLSIIVETNISMLKTAGV